MEGQVRGAKIGRYEILTQLTSGGMAELFLCFTTGPGGFRKYVVVKRILPDAKDNDQFVNMFLDEARITAAFNHPNIAQVYELEEDKAGPYMAMEFIAGQNLNQVTSACATQQAVLPIGYSASVAHDLALALHYAHTFKDPAGKPFPVIHRDVAQKNIMVTYSGIVKLLDFGIAKARGSLGKTSAGTVKGTTGYMSPEQVRGEPLDGRSDVFALGVVLWEMVTGRRLFAGETEIEEMKLILNAPIHRPTEIIDVVPDALSDIILKALARDREQRYTAREFARALELGVPQLLFDQEQRAQFMDELFHEKVEATQQMMEAAGGDIEKSALAAAVNVLNGSSGQGFAPVAGPGEKKKAKVPARKRNELPPVAKVAGRRTATPTENEGAALARPATEQAAAAAAVRDTNTNDEAGSGIGGVLLPLGVLVVVVAGLFAVWKFVLTGGPSDDVPPLPEDAIKAVPIPRPPERQPANVPVVPQPMVPMVPQAAVPDAGAAAATGPTGATGATGTTGAKVAEPVVSGKKGTLTLVTIPSAKVFRGGKELGETPLFNLELPVGTHLLTLVGADNVKRKLSVRVAQGKNAPMKIELADLPTK